MGYTLQEVGVVAGAWFGQKLRRVPGTHKCTRCQMLILNEHVIPKIKTKYYCEMCYAASFMEFSP